MSIEHDALEGFELVKKGQGQRTTDPQLTIYGNGGGYLNAVALDVLGDHPAVRTFVDRDETRIAIVGADGEGEHDYALDRDSETSGGDFRAQGALRLLDIDPDSIEETRQFELANEDGVLVGDVSALAVIADVTDDAPQDADDEDVEQAVDEVSDPSDEPDPDTVAEEITEQATPDEDTQTISQGAPESKTTVPEPDHSSPQPDVPAIEDDSKSVTEKTRAYLNHLLDGEDTITLTCGEIADAIDEDGRGIPAAFRSLDDEFDIEQTGREGRDGVSIWAISEPTADDEDTDDQPKGSTNGEAPDTPQDTPVYWCGRCGAGQFEHAGKVEDHHERKGHAGNPIPRAIEPTEAELVTNPDSVEPPSGPLRDQILHVLEANTPEYQWFKTADIAIQLDAAGNRVERLLEEMEPSDGFVVERHDNIWRVRPAGGEE